MIQTAVIIIVWTLAGAITAELFGMFCQEGEATRRGEDV
jgi:hypothetical protein